LNAKSVKKNKVLLLLLAIIGEIYVLMIDIKPSEIKIILFYTYISKV